MNTEARERLLQCGWPEGPKLEMAVSMSDHPLFRSIGLSYDGLEHAVDHASQIGLEAFWQELARDCLEDLAHDPPALKAAAEILGGQSIQLSLDAEDIGVLLSLLSSEACLQAYKLDRQTIERIRRVIYDQAFTQTTSTPSLP